jgi:hypothetical protein
MHHSLLDPASADCICYLWSHSGLSFRDLQLCSREYHLTAVTDTELCDAVQLSLPCKAQASVSDRMIVCHVSESNCQITSRGVGVFAYAVRTRRDDTNLTRSVSLRLTLRLTPQLVVFHLRYHPIDPCLLHSQVPFLIAPERFTAEDSRIARTSSARADATSGTRQLNSRTLSAHTAHVVHGPSRVLAHVFVGLERNFYCI